MRSPNSRARADGSLRDGLSLLDQAIAYGAGSVRAADVRAMLGTIERGRVFALARCGRMPATARRCWRRSIASPNFRRISPACSTKSPVCCIACSSSSWSAITSATEEADDAGIDALAAALAPEETQLVLPDRHRRSPRSAARADAARRLRNDDAAHARVSSAGAHERAPLPSRAAQPPQASRDHRAHCAARTCNSRRAASLPKRRDARTRAIRRDAPGVAEPHRQSLQSQQWQMCGVDPSTASTAPVDTSDWPALIEAAGLKGPVGQLAQHASLIAIEGGVVRLALKPAHEHFNCAAAGRNDGTEAWRRARPSGQGAFRESRRRRRKHRPKPRERERSARQLAAEESLAGDPGVQSLLREFGGRLRRRFAIRREAERQASMEK